MEREALWREIMANPDDDEPRLVFADWLLQRNEPLGELIALQCRAGSAKDRASMERAAELFRANEERWKVEFGLGEKERVSYERGPTSRACRCMPAR